MEQDTPRLEMKKILNTLLGKELNDFASREEMRTVIKSFSNELTDEEVNGLINEMPWGSDSTPTFETLLFVNDD